MKPREWDEINFVNGDGPRDNATWVDSDCVFNERASVSKLRFVSLFLTK